jgi:hypothetical protein
MFLYIFKVKSNQTFRRQALWEEKAAGSSCCPEDLFPRE